jgi:hypothetical protein
MVNEKSSLPISEPNTMQVNGGMSRSVEMECRDAMEDNCYRPDVRLEPVTVQFRWHRGGYAESMATTQLVTRTELQSLIGAWTTKHYGPDARNGWDTWLVMTDGPVGWTDGDI